MGNVMGCSVEAATNVGRGGMVSETTGVPPAIHRCCRSKAPTPNRLADSFHAHLRRICCRRGRGEIDQVGLSTRLS